MHEAKAAQLAPKMLRALRAAVRANAAAVAARYARCAAAVVDAASACRREYARQCMRANVPR
jgi:hypothetical protein